MTIFWRIANKSFSVCRYFEGQLTDISELDAEELPDDSPVRVVEAAEKVHSILLGFAVLSLVFFSYFNPFFCFAMRMPT